MKKFKEQLQAVLQALGFVDKAKSNDLSKDDWKKIADSYKESHGTDMYTDMNEAKEEAEKSEQDAEKAASHDAALQILNASTAGDDNGGEEAPVSLEKSVEKVNAKVTQLETENKEMRTALEKVTPENVETVEVNVAVTGAGMNHSDTHLFGVQDSMYAVNTRWNELFVNPNAVHAMGNAEPEQIDAFAKEMRSFGSKVAKAFNALHADRKLNVDILRSSSNPDLTALTNAGLGDQFVQFRVRELIARILELPTIFDIFPKRSGIQDRDIITNAFVGELTQAWQDSETALKGSITLDPETGYVDDAMILSKFGEYKKLERQYIGYLNTSGSDPVKWAMIEWSMLQFMKQAHKEQMQRYIRGIHIKPEENVPGHFLTASTGILNRIKLYAIERKIRPIVDDTMNTYDNTGTVFIDTLIEAGAWVNENLCPLGIEQEEVEVFANKNHKPWFISGFRRKFNLDGDFKGIETSEIPDTQIKITWVPNMGNHKMFWVTSPGNMQCLENIPGEMNKFYMERRLNNVYVQSTWKEGTSAAYAGIQATSENDLNSREWDKQMIWFPKPFIDLADGATTADANNGSWFRTVDNAAGTKITDISNKKAGELYIIEVEGTADVTTIDKAGLFSEIKENYEPTAVGDALGVVWDAKSSKFREVFRKVGGNFAYYTETSPNAGKR